MKTNLKVCLYCARYNEEAFKVRPLGISYLASYLIDKQIVPEEHLRIVDNLEEAIAFKPDIIGVSSVSQVIGDACDFVQKCKSSLGCLAILGGYHITSAPDQLPEVFDVGVLGEGELTFAELVNQVSACGSNLELSRISGICYREPAGDIRQTAPRDHVVDIDALPWPLRHKSYAKEEPIFTSRGCPYRCTFCASQKFWRNKVRFRSAGSVVAEILHIIEKHRPEEIAILDDLWMADKARFKEIVTKLVALGVPEKVTFRGFCRSNIIDEETIELLKALNYRFIRFGAETGSERLLKVIKGEGISIKDHQRVINLCRKHGMTCGASFMFGIPGETREDLQETIRFLRKNSDCFQIIGFYLFNPIPGTALWDQLKQDGVVVDQFDFHRLQLDLLRADFSWDDVLYYNESEIPLEDFRRIVTDIRAEFIDRSFDSDKRRFLPKEAMKKIVSRFSVIRRSKLN